MLFLSGLGAFRAALGHRNYRLYVTGNAVSLIGTWMQQLAVGWLAWALTESPAWLGVIVFLDLFPAALLSPLGGALADRFDRLKVMIAVDLAGMGLSVLLFALTAAGVLGIWGLAGLVVLNASTFALRHPARLALPPSLVPARDLPAAIALNSIVFNSARFVGPAVAGFTIAWAGVSVAFLANAISSIAFIAAVLAMRFERRPISGDAERTSLNPLASLGAATAYVARHPALGPLLAALGLVSLLARPITELMPGFVGDVFAAGPEALGLLTATIGAGAILGALGVAGRRDPRRLAGDAFLGQAAAGLLVAGFALAGNFWVSLVLIGLAGVAMSTSGISTQTAVQLAVDDAMRGRVMSLYIIQFRAAPALGALGIGLVAEGVGLPLPVALAAGTASVIGLIAWFGRGRVAAGIADGPAESDPPAPAGTGGPIV